MITSLFTLPMNLRYK